MRVMFLFTALTLAGSASAAPMARDVLNSPLCRDPLIHHSGPAREARLHRLTDLPPASALHAMLERDKDGCLRAVPVGSRSVMAPPARQRR